MTLGDAAAAITSAIRHHTGLHYVPSFNDFATNSADDCEQLEMDRETGRRDQDTGASGPAPRKMSNKLDDSVPAMTSTLGDVHKIDRSILGPGAGRADWLYDRPREGRASPSVWQYILHSQGGKASMPAFTEMAPSKSATIGAADLQKHLNVTRAQAEAMVAEADRNKDNRISNEEFDDILAEVCP